MIRWNRARAYKGGRATIALLFERDATQTPFLILGNDAGDVLGEVEADTEAELAAWAAEIGVEVR